MRHKHKPRLTENRFDIIVIDGSAESMIDDRQLKRKLIVLSTGELHVQIGDCGARDTTVTLDKVLGTVVSEGSAV